jgi:hypothetical protein
LDYNEIDSNINILTETEFSYSCKVTAEIKNLAKKIVKKSKNDIDAAKKLAKWINKNIKHEVEAGFYQSPSETLKNRKGNCCCHAELFLQMCDAIGLTKNHRLDFIHVGTMEFKHRHFFAIFDNICVDCDCIFSNPWGHGKFSSRDVYQETMYPLLPLKKTY